jgi:Family of unknown function (DUF6338)
VPDLPLDKLQPELTFEKFQFFLVLVVPGLVAIKCYDLFVPRSRNLANVLIEAVLYSLVNFTIFFWALLPLNAKGFAEAHTTCYVLAMFVLIGVTPCLLAFATYRFRTSKPAYSWLGLDHPHRTGWEHFMAKRQACYMLFHLKDGDKFGGFYGENSYAATYPEEPEVYVEKVYEVDEHGAFVKEIEGTLGTVVRLADIERVELLQIPPDPNQQPAAPTWWKRLFQLIMLPWWKRPVSVFMSRWPMPSARRTPKKTITLTSPTSTTKET